MPPAATTEPKPAKPRGIGNPPEDRRCQRIKRNGERCGSWAVTGRKFCRSHGGRTTTAMPIARTEKSRRAEFAKLREEGRAILDELVQDPDLLDPKITIAASHYLTLQLPIDPPEDVVETMARLAVKRRLPKLEEGETRDPEDLEPTEADREMIRMRLREVAGKELREHGKLQIAALKQKTEADLLLQGAMPVLEEYNDQVMRLIAKYLEPEKRIQFADDLRQSLEAAIGRLKRLKGG